MTPQQTGRFAWEADGWYPVAIRGRHRQFKHPVKADRVTVPGRMNDDLVVKTYQSLLTQAGVKIMKDLIIIEDSSTGQSAYSPDLPGCVSTGSSEEAVVANMREAESVMALLRVGYRSQRSHRSPSFGEQIVDGSRRQRGCDRIWRATGTFKVGENGLLGPDVVSPLDRQQTAGRLHCPAFTRPLGTTSSIGENHDEDACLGV